VAVVLHVIAIYLLLRSTCRWLFGRSKPSAFVPSSMAFQAVVDFRFRPLVNGFTGGRSLPLVDGVSGGRRLPLSSHRPWLFRRSKPSAFVPSSMAFPAVEAFPSSMALRAVRAFRFRPLVNGLSGGRSLPLVEGCSGGRSLPISSPRQWPFGRSKPSPRRGLFGRSKPSHFILWHFNGSKHSSHSPCRWLFGRSKPSAQPITTCFSG
jgi:hypothetical protein